MKTSNDHKTACPFCAGSGRERTGGLKPEACLDCNGTGQAAGRGSDITEIARERTPCEDLSGGRADDLFLDKMHVGCLRNALADAWDAGAAAVLRQTTSVRAEPDAEELETTARRLADVFFTEELARGYEISRRRNFKDREAIGWRSPNVSSSTVVLFVREGSRTSVAVGIPEKGWSRSHGSSPNRDRGFARTLAGSFGLQEMPTAEAERLTFEN